MAPKTSIKQQTEIYRLKDELDPKGITLRVPPNSTHITELDLEWIALEQWNDKRVIVSLEQLRAGLPIPLFNPELPPFYEILSHLEDPRAICQLCGDAIIILVEYSRRTAGLNSLYPKYAKPYNRKEYTVENFSKHNCVKLVAHGDRLWGILFKRKDEITENDRITRDVDFHRNSNDSARFSNDPHWTRFPLIVEGPYIWGCDADCSTRVLSIKYLGASPIHLDWKPRSSAMWSVKSSSRCVLVMKHLDFA